MKLKYISLLLMGGVLATSLTSCEDFGDSMLTQNNPNEMTTDVFWANLDDCNAGLNAVYKTFSNQNIYLIGEESNRADITWPGVYPAFTTTNEYYNHQFTDASASIGAKWATLYEGIFRANQVIKGLEGIKADMTTDDDMRSWELIMGQARFFRGLFHHYLNKTYNEGNVPIMNFVPANESEFLLPCSESQLVKDFYREDLKYAESVLPVKGAEDDWSRDTGTMGRVTSGAASTVLGVSYLYDNEYATAKTYFKKLLDNSSYALTNSYKDNFSSVNEFNSESILEISYSLDYNTEYGLWDARNLSNTLGLILAPGTVGGWGPTVIPSYWLTRDFMREPVDRLNPNNVVKLEHDIHGDIYYFNEKSVTETTDGGKIYHSYPVIPNPKNHLVDQEMTYYTKKIEVDASGVPVQKDLTSLSEEEINKIYTLLASGDKARPIRAYANSQGKENIAYTSPDGKTSITNQQTGDVWEIFYDDAGEPYRYKVHTERASSSIVLFTEMDMPYYKNPQPYVVWPLSNAISCYRKYTNWDICETEKDISPLVRSAINFRMLRLSDVYLMYAECLIEGGTNEGGVSEAMQYINRVRKRAGTVLIGSESDAMAEFKGSATYQDTPDVEGTSRSYVNLYERDGEDYVIATANDVMKHLMYKERPLELCLEGHSIRFNDMRRWGITQSRFDELSRQAYATWAFPYYSLETKEFKESWTWGMDYDENLKSTFSGPKYQYIDAASNYKDKAYYPIPNDEALANPEIGTVVKAIK